MTSTTGEDAYRCCRAVDVEDLYLLFHSNAVHRQRQAHSLSDLESVYCDVSNPVAITTINHFYTTVALK